MTDILTPNGLIWKPSPRTLAPNDAPNSVNFSACFQDSADRSQYCKLTLEQQAALLTTSNAKISALNAEVNRGQWVVKDGQQIRIEAGSPSGWTTSGNPGIIINNVQLATITANFAVPMSATGLEWAIWYIQEGSPTTRAKIGGKLWYPNGTQYFQQAIPDSTVGATNDFWSYNLTSVPNTSGNKGVYSMTITAPNNVTFQLLGAGVRFREGEALS